MRKSRTIPNLHEQITAQLISAIEANPGIPEMPWRQSKTRLALPVNALTSNPYSGINIVNLWVGAIANQYPEPKWATYRQWQQLGAQVRKGEKASLLVFYREIAVTPDPDDQSDDGLRHMARASCVFNASQVDGYEDEPDDETVDLGPIERLASTDAFIKRTGAKISHGGDQAYYDRNDDHIQMPDEKLFSGSSTMSRTEGYYATVLHELVHWTGPAHRLNRQLGKRYADAAYATEELVAEIGAAFLCAEMGVTQETRPDHAQYIGSWLRALKKDNRLIFTAAARASEAVAFLHKVPSPHP